MGKRQKHLRAVKDTAVEPAPRPPVPDSPVDVISKAFVAMAEVDYDLRAWEALHQRPLP